jgi:hypothetical protein
VAYVVKNRQRYISHTSGKICCIKEPVCTKKQKKGMLSLLSQEPSKRIAILAGRLLPNQV